MWVKNVKTSTKQTNKAVGTAQQTPGVLAQKLQKTDEQFIII